MPEKPKATFWSLLMLVSSGLILLGGGLVTAAWALLPLEYPLAWTNQPQCVWRDHADKVIAVDMQTGAVSRGNSIAFANTSTLLEDGSWFYYDDQAANRVGGTSIAVVDPHTQQIVRRVNLDSFSSTSLVGRRYLVSWDKTSLKAYDLTTDNAPAQQLTWNPLVATREPTARIGEPRFVMLVSGAAGSAHELYEIAPSGIQLKTSWPIGRPGHIFAPGDSVTVINASSTGLERRSLETGELLASHPMPPKFDTQAVDIGYSQYYVVTLGTDQRIRHFHAATGNELDLGVSFSLAHDIPGTTCGLFLSRDSEPNASAFVVDQLTNQLRWSFHLPWSRYQFVEIGGDGSVWIISSRMGLTSYLLDIDKGRLDVQSQPFAWVPWSLAILGLSSFVWLRSWRGFVAQQNWSVWWEYYVLLIWVLGLMTFRMWFVYEPTGFSRIPAAIGYGIVLASLQVAVLWIWLGRGRIVDRLLHLTVILIIVGLSFRILHVPRADGWPSILLVYCVIPMVGMLLSPLVLRWSKTYQALRQNAAANRPPEVYSLKTLLAATAILAILATVYRTILPSLPQIRFPELSYDYFAGSAAVALLACVTALSNRRGLVYRTAAVVAMLLMLALLAYVCTQAFMGAEPLPFYRYATDRFRCIALGTTFSFAFWMIARLQNSEVRSSKSNSFPAASWPPT